MNFKLEILTPVNLGCGELLSPYSDYIYDKGYVYYIDHDLLLKELSQKPDNQRLIDEFVKVVQSQAKSNVSDKFKLKSFLERVGLDFEKYSYKKLPASEEIREQVQLHVKSAGQPYIPGSSLKGAIRTALLTHFLSLEDEQLMKYIAEEERKSRGFFRYIGQDQFGKFNEDKLKYLQVSDSLPFNQEGLKIVKFYKYNLKSGSLTIPIVKEVIVSGVSTCRIKMSAKKGEINGKLSLLLAGNEAALLEIINKYASKNVAMELEQLERFTNEETREMEKFYRSLLESIKSADKAKEAYLRIGSGKTYYDNTIAQKLSSKTKKEIITRNFRRANPNAFPITRTVILDGGKKEVPGWVRISKP